jgi:DNA-binding Lrp family transcriptional regulator
MSLPKSSSIVKVNKNDYSPKQIKLLDNTNIRIISEILRQPNISSLSLSKKIDIPLSTLQRRRAIVEKEILKKNYTFNYKAFGGRVGDLIVNVAEGRADEVAQNIIKKHKNNVDYCHTRIDLTHNVLAHIVYKYTEELHYLIEDIRAMEYTKDVQWSELVNVVGDNASGVISAFFSGK